MHPEQSQKNKIFLKLITQKGPNTRIAVVGASNNRGKYGNIIVRNLLEKGYTVLPVNPGAAEIEGQKAYADLAQVPGPVDIVNVVTPPAVSLQALVEAEKAGFPVVWFQTGSFDQKVLDALDRSPVIGITDACIMVIAARSEKQ